MIHIDAVRAVRPFPFQRGYAAVGLLRPKTGVNVGSVLRAAHCYDVAMVAIAGDRSKWGIRHASNTPKTERHIPVLLGSDLKDMIPYGAVPVAVDLVEGADPLPAFRHPSSAFYVFGPEDGTLGANVLSWCPYRVMVKNHIETQAAEIAALLKEAANG